MASLKNRRLNGYYANNRDINRNYVLEPRFECPICLTCLKKPYITSCGHRFCQDCIKQWLKERSSCPVDDNIMSEEKDLFPDNYTRREISQEKIDCPFPDCGEVVPLLELDSHIETHKEADTVDAKTDCPFKSIGCEEVFSRQSLLVQHTFRCMNKHLELLITAHNKLSQQIIPPLNEVVTDKEADLAHNKLPQQIHPRNGVVNDQEAALWDPPPKQPGSPVVLDPSQALIRNLYERIIVLEQKTTEQEVQLNNAKRQIEKMEQELQSIDAREQVARMIDERQKFEADLALRVCNGIYVWNLTDMRSKIECFFTNPNQTYFSEGFYTSYSGYKFIARIHLSPDSKYISLLIHLMKGENDYALQWPFSGRIVFTLMHPIDRGESLREVMWSRPDLEAFKRPTKNMNTRGFGYSEFILIEDLRYKNFYYGDGSINIKIEISCV